MNSSLTSANANGVGLRTSEAPFAAADGYAAWRCPWCGWANNRKHEGLDACDNCGSEAKTQYAKLDDERLVVVWAYEPEKRHTAEVSHRAPN